MATTQLTLQPADASSTTRPTAARTAATGAVLAALAGAAWFALGIESIVRPDPRDFRNIAFVMPWALTLMAIVTLHRMQRHRGDRLELHGYRAVVVTMIVAGLGHLVLVATDVGIGLAAVPLWVVAMAAFGIGTVRAGVVPRHVGIMLAVSQLIVIAIALALSPIVPLQSDGSFSGAVGHGLTFVIVALALRSLARGAQRVD